MLLVWLVVVLVRRRRTETVAVDTAPSSTLVQLARATLVLSAAQRAGERHTQADAFGFHRHPRLTAPGTEPAAVTAVIAEATGDLELAAETSSTAAHVF